MSETSQNQAGGAIVLESVLHDHAAGPEGGRYTGGMAGTGAIPLQPTPLVGREADLAAACARLADPDVRLLTFVGPPGVGKTRLAFAVAERLAPAFEGAVALVELAPLADPALLPAAVAARLGVREQGDRPLLDQV